jgi:hypothetical protein
VVDAQHPAHGGQDIPGAGRPLQHGGALPVGLADGEQPDYLLDHHLGADGLDVLTAPPLPRK